MPKIFILEPDESLAGTISGAIQNTGLAPIVINSGREFVPKFKKEQPSLIVLDLCIDDGNGLQLCHAIRETPGGELIPILLLGTGNEGVKSFGDALVEGGDYYFAKPVDMGKLILKIQTYVGANREITKVASPSPELMKEVQRTTDTQEDTQVSSIPGGQTQAQVEAPQTDRVVTEVAKVSMSQTEESILSQTQKDLEPTEKVWVAPDQEETAHLERTERIDIAPTSTRKPFTEMDRETTKTGKPPIDFFKEHQKGSEDSGSLQPSDSSLELAQKEKEAHKREGDLVGRVEHMLGLGTAFKDGLLEPPAGDDDKHLLELEQQLFGEKDEQSTSPAAVSSFMCKTAFPVILLFKRVLLFEPGSR